MELKLASLRECSLSFNQLFEANYVSRDHLLDEIEELASNDCKLIIIEGNEGIGKTYLLLQFAHKHLFDCFTYFINPACRSTIKQDYLMDDLGRQISFYLESEIIEGEVTPAIFAKLLFDLLSKPGKKGRPLFFVIDGLDQIEKVEAESLKSILDLLPWASNNFYFIVSGSSEKLASLLPAQALKKSKSFRVIRFTLEETCKLFKWETTHYAREVHETWNGHPERLSQVKRLLDSGLDIQDFLTRNDISEKDNLLEIEWKQSELDKLDFNSEVIQLICILAFDDNIRSINKIISVLNCEKDEIINKVKDISFLTYKNDEVSFVSASYRQFSIKKLKKYEKRTFSLLISYYTDKDDISTVLNLPTLYEKDQDWLGIINLLTTNNLELTISNSKSFSDIKKQIDFGYRASKSLKKSYENIFRFSLYRSLVNGLQKSDIRSAQIQAYIALNKQDEAFSLISNAVLKEDRLKMLIRYGKECKLRKLNIDSLIIKEIKDLLEGIDAEFLKENIVEITIGLAHFLPEDAVQVIERASGLKSETGSLEWLLNYISYIIIQNKEESSYETIKVQFNNEKNNDSFINRFTKSIGIGINDISELEVLDSISKIENIADKLYLVRTWISKNERANNIMEIMEFAIGLLLQSSSTTKPTTTTLLEIVSPLAFINNKETIQSMINRLDELIISINSPTSDKIRLQLLIIESIALFDINEANSRMVEVYDVINKITDYSIKIEAFADCWCLVKNLERKHNIIATDFILETQEIKENIVTNINILLSHTANQFSELENTIKIISTIDFLFTIEVSKKINTIERRELAIVLALETYTGQEIQNWDENVIKDTISLLTIESNYSDALISLFESAYNQQAQTINYKNKIQKLIPLIERISIYNTKCHLLSIVIRLLILDSTNSTQLFLLIDIEAVALLSIGLSCESAG